jgi:hypothetical protein
MKLDYNSLYPTSTAEMLQGSARKLAFRETQLHLVKKGKEKGHLPQSVLVE